MPVGSGLLFVEALRALPSDRTSLYWAGRATLVHGPEQVAPYDRAFARWWLGAPTATAEPAVEEPVTLEVDDGEGESPPDGLEPDDDDVQSLRFSAHEVLRHRDFATLDDSERAEVNRLMADLRLVGGGAPVPTLDPQPSPFGPAGPAPHHPGLAADRG